MSRIASVLIYIRVTITGPCSSTSGHQNQKVIYIAFKCKPTAVSVSTWVFLNTSVRTVNCNRACSLQLLASVLQSAPIFQGLSTRSVGSSSIKRCLTQLSNSNQLRYITHRKSRRTVTGVSAQPGHCSTIRSLFGTCYSVVAYGQI